MNIAASEYSYSWIEEMYDNTTWKVLGAPSPQAELYLVALKATRLRHASATLPPMRSGCRDWATASLKQSMLRESARATTNLKYRPVHLHATLILLTTLVSICMYQYMCLVAVLSIGGIRGGLGPLWRPTKI